MRLGKARLDKLSGLGLFCLKSDLELNDLTPMEGEAAWLDQEENEDNQKRKEEC